VAKNNRRLGVVYPEEREGKLKDANRKLKSQIRNLKKRLSILETENKTLRRGFYKNCDFIQEKLEDKTLEEILKMVEEFNYKENSRDQKLKKKEEKKDFTLTECPKCSKKVKEGYTVMDFKKFKVNSCICGYRERVENSEGNCRS
jgi:hypothetical protein